jgi:hypothetical protein
VALNFNRQSEINPQSAIENPITGFRDWLFQLERRPVSTETNSIQEEQFGYDSNNEGAA